MKIIEGIYTYEEALAKEGDGWRLPTIFELITIQKESSDTLFYWSASPLASSSSYAWFVNFSNGNDSYNGRSYHFFYVQLVRSGQTFNHLTPVTQTEVEQYKATGTLPEWHKEIDHENN